MTEQPVERFDDDEKVHCPTHQSFSGDSTVDNTHAVDLYDDGVYEPEEP